MCIFCQIVSKEIDSATIYENDEFKVILDKFPSSLGHVLVITKKHIENIFELPSDLGSRMFELVVKLAPLVKQQLNCEGINILQNNDKVAGQSVNHFHIHIIPRYKNDNITINWKTQAPKIEDIEKIKNDLKELIYKTI